MAKLEVILVTGGTGYVAAFSIFKLLQKGYNVRTTVRSISRADYLKSNILGLNYTTHVTDKEDELIDVNKALIEENLSFYEADLTNDSGWQDAIKGVDYIQHIASPVIETTIAEEDMIIPVKEGTLRVLRFAHYLNVKRAVIMSSCGTITYNNLKLDAQGNPPKLTEKNWTSLETSQIL